MVIDPLSVATTFATLVSLISDFRSEHDKVANDDHQKFLEWLSSNRHTKLVSLLEQNQATTTSIKSILNLQSSELLEKLKSIDNRLGNILSFDPNFSDLVKAIAPQVQLSKQALNILSQFERSGSSRVVEFKTMPEYSYIFVDKKAPDLVFEEKIFIQDDFLSLISYGLLKTELDNGRKVFIYTRAASELIKQAL